MVISARLGLRTRLQSTAAVSRTPYGPNPLQLVSKSKELSIKRSSDKIEQGLTADVATYGQAPMRAREELVMHQP